MHGMCAGKRSVGRGSSACRRIKQAFHRAIVAAMSWTVCVSSSWRPVVDNHAKVWRIARWRCHCTGTVREALRRGRPRVALLMSSTVGAAVSARSGCRLAVDVDLSGIPAVARGASGNSSILIAALPENRGHRVVAWTCWSPSRFPRDSSETQWLNDPETS